MYMGRMPLYPPPGGERGRENCIRLPLFQNDSVRQPPANCAQTVRLENPCCPGEFAEVTLSVDYCGNLAVCVHREPYGCRPRPPKHRSRDCCCR